MPNAGTRQARGYGRDHTLQRKAWEPRVARGEGTCHAERCLEPTRYIAPGSEWHMGHTPDRTRWTGPEHPRCNTTEGAIRGAAARAGLKHSREW